MLSETDIRYPLSMANKFIVTIPASLSFYCYTDTREEALARAKVIMEQSGEWTDTTDLDRELDVVSITLTPGAEPAITWGPR